MKPDDKDNEPRKDDVGEAKELPIEDVMDASDYDVEISEEDFFDELDQGIDSYFQNLRKKK
ncbi:MAG: hypothetical protein IJK07_06300 [Bacteroidales bacterium]|nr:hypothetical protein [Bacteroidales bacterium]